MRQKEDNKVKEIKRVHLNSSAVKSYMGLYQDTKVTYKTECSGISIHCVKMYFCDYCDKS